MHWNRQGTSLIAPSLLAFEVVSTLRRLVYLKEITPDEGMEAFQRFLALDIHLSDQPAVLTLAWEFARRFNRPRACDTAYLAVARLNGCELWTADKRLYDTVKKLLPWVRYVEEDPVS